jgi:hypothetical protein
MYSFYAPKTQNNLHEYFQSNVQSYYAKYTSPDFQEIIIIFSHNCTQI